VTLLSGASPTVTAAGAPKGAAGVSVQSACVGIGVEVGVRVGVSVKVAVRVNVGVTVGVVVGVSVGVRVGVSVLIGALLTCTIGVARKVDSVAGAHAALNQRITAKRHRRKDAKKCLVKKVSHSAKPHPIPSPKGEASTGSKSPRPWERGFRGEVGIKNACDYTQAFGDTGSALFYISVLYVP